MVSPAGIECISNHMIKRIKFMDVHIYSNIYTNK